MTNRRMATHAPFNGGGVGATGPAAPTTTENLAETERYLLAKKPWPAFLLVGSDAMDDWETCPVTVKDALQWMASSTVGLLDIASVGPLTPVCQAFKALIEAAGGAADAEEKLRELISWCASIIGFFIKLGKTGDTLSEIPVHQCLQDFESTANRLAKRAKKLATRHKFSAFLWHRKDTAEIANYDGKLRKIWADIRVLATVDVRQAQRVLLPHKMETMAAVPIGALSPPDSYVERTCMVEEVVHALTTSDAGSPSHMLLGLGGGGKTVLASSVVRHEGIRKHFRQGIFWISVGQGGKDQLHALFQGLAREVGAAPTDTPHGIPSDGFSSLPAVVQHLTAVARTGLPRLVVLDDVWEREVVDTVLPTGLVLLVTTRNESVVTGFGGTSTDVGDMTEEEATKLLRRASGIAGSPRANVEEAIKQVARDCGFFPLALAIVGSMPVVKGRGSSTQPWRQLHKDLENRGDMLLEKCGAKTSVHRVLDASYDELGTRRQNLFLRLAVLPKGAVAPEDMLLNLWEVEDVQETRDEARGLMGRSLLQAAGKRGYRVHDLLVDFARHRISPAQLELATKCQAQYLGRLHHVRACADQGNTEQGFYALMSLWRSVEDLSHNPRLQVEEYNTSLTVLEEDESIDAAGIYGSLGHLFRLQGKHAEAEALYLRALGIEEKVLGPDHPGMATTLGNLAALLTEQGKHAEAEALYVRALGIEEKVLGPDHPGMATTLGNLAVLLTKQMNWYSRTSLRHLQGKHAEAEALYLRALGIEEKVLGPDHPGMATTLGNLAALLTEQGKHAEAEALYLRALGIEEKVLGPDHPGMATTFGNLAALLTEQGKHAEAEALYLRALGIEEKVLGPDHPGMATTLGNLAALLTEQGKHAEAEALYLRALGINQKVLGPDHPGMATTLGNLAVLLTKQGKHAEAEALYLRALGIKEKVLGPDHPGMATTLGNLALLLQEQGKHAEAEALYLRALGINEKVLGPDHPGMAITLGNLALLLKEQGKHAEAEALYLRALGIEEKVLGHDHPGMATTLGNLALLLKEQGKHAEAEALYLRALGIEEKVLGPDHPGMATTLGNLALLLKEQGKHAEAEALYLRALGIEEKVLGPDHPGMATTLGNLALLLKEQGKHAEAEALYLRALGIEEKVLGPDHPGMATTLGNLALLLKEQGKHAEAEALYLRALGIEEKVLGPDHPGMATTLGNLALLLKEQGKHAEAEALYLRALGIEEKVLGPDHPGMATTLGNLALLLQEQGKHAEAEALYLRALGIEEKVLGPDHPGMATTLGNLALLLKEQGKHAEAEALYLRALGIEEKVLGSDHPGMATTLGNLALLLKEQGKHAEAEALYLRALGIEEKVLGSDHPGMATTLGNLALLLQEQGKHAEAEALYLRAVGMQEKILGPDHPKLATTLANLARLLKEQGIEDEYVPPFTITVAMKWNYYRDIRKLANISLVRPSWPGKYAEAESLYLRAIGIDEKALGPSHHEVATTFHNLSELFLAQGKHNEAIQTFERALTIMAQKLGAKHASTVITRQALERARYQVGPTE